MMKWLVASLAVCALAACSGVRTTGDSYSAHAENFNILFLQIPGGDTQERAMELVPAGSDVVTMTSTPKDTSSLIGFLNRLIGIDITFVNGSTKKE